MKYTLTTINIWEAALRVMVAKLTKLTHKIVMQLHLVAQSYTIRSSCSRQPVQKLLDMPSYIHTHRFLHWSLHMWMGHCLVMQASVSSKSLHITVRWKEYPSVLLHRQCSIVLWTVTIQYIMRKFMTWQTWAMFCQDPNTDKLASW
jgi:hypothetical protein